MFLNHIVKTLRTELEDANTKLHLYQTKYDRLESKANAQAELHAESLETLDKYNGQIFELRQKLQTVQLEKKQLEIKIMQHEECKEQIKELSEQNRYLEDQVTRLCEAPFSEKASRAVNFVGFPEQEKNVDQCRNEVKILEANNRGLTEESNCLRIEKETLQRDCDELREHIKQLESAPKDIGVITDDVRDEIYAHNLLQSPITQINSSSDVDVSNSKVVDCNSDADKLKQLPNNSSTSSTTDEDAILSLKRTIRQLKNDICEAKKDFERTEKILKTQVEINDMLQAKLESVDIRKDEEKRSLLKKAHEIEKILMQRLERIRYLEVQLEHSSSNIKNKGFSRDMDGKLAPCKHHKRDSLTSEESKRWVEE
eukprot:15364464-Ditylum_brightwellii.AAC.1